MKPARNPKRESAPPARKPQAGRSARARPGIASTPTSAPTPRPKAWRVLRAKGGHEVKIYRHVQHGEQRYVIAWYTADGRQRVTRTDRTQAEDEAATVLRRLVAYGPQARTIDRESADLLDRLRTVAGDSAGGLAQLVAQVEAAVRVLGPTGLTIEEAARVVAARRPKAARSSVANTRAPR